MRNARILLDWNDEMGEEDEVNGIDHVNEAQNVALEKKPCEDVKI